MNKIKSNFVVNDQGSKTKLINNPFDNLNIHLFINDKETNFEYEYQFNGTGEYLVEFRFNEELTNLSSLFMDVINLKKIDLTGIVTDKVKNMDNLFKGCISLESANLNKINTFNVESMKSMFQGCSNLIKIDMENFITSSTKITTSMFENCYNLSEININFFNFTNI